MLSRVKHEPSGGVMALAKAEARAGSNVQICGWMITRDEATRGVPRGGADAGYVWRSACLAGSGR